MRFLAFVRYSIESVLRNRKRSLYAIIGIVIALSLIAGSWIAVDSSGIGLLRAAIDDIPMDFVAYASYNSGEISESRAAETVAAIESTEHVTDAIPFITRGNPYYMNGSGGFYTYDGSWNFSGTLLFLSNDSQQLLDSFKISGEVPAPGTVAIPKAIADALELGVGDSITFVFVQETYEPLPDGNYSVNTTYLNITRAVSSIWTQQPSSGGGAYPYLERGDYSSVDGDHISLYSCYDPAVLNIADYGSIDANITAFSPYLSKSISYMIWIDRGEVIRLANVRSTIERLDFIQHQIAKKVFSYGLTVDQSLLVSPLESVNYELESRKPLFLALSAPVIALGMYLSMVGVDLGVTERRREAGILKSRGASNKQVFASLIVESLALGAFAGVAGLVVGLLVSRFLLNAVTSLSFYGEAESAITDFLVSSTTVVLCVLFGIVLMLASSYRPFKRVSKTDVAEALHHYSPVATELEYKPRTDLILLSLSILSVVTILVGLDWPSRQGWSWIVELIVSILFLVGIVIFPLLPFILSISVVRLLTRGSRRLYSKFTWLVKPWTKELHHLVDRNIVRNPRRASNLCLIISLALAFGLFISVTMESTMTYEREQIHYEVGADIKLESWRMGYGESAPNVSKLSELASLPGVEHVARNYQVEVYFEIAWGAYGGWAAIFNATDYRETAKPSGFYFIDGGSEMLEDLETNGTVLLTKGYARDNDLLVGDVLPARISLSTYHNGSWYYDEYRFNVMVVGLVKGLPGFTNHNVFIDRRSLSFIPEENLTAGAYYSGAFIDVEDGADPHGVANSAVALFQSANLSASATILEDRLAELYDDPTFASLAGFLYMEYALSIAIMTIGVGLLIFVAVHDREKELACIMARGSSGAQVRKILMGESMTLMVLGLIVGSAVGLLTAYLFNTLSGEELYTVVERRMIFTFVSFSIVLSSIVALLLASLFATARAGKIKLAEVLRIRGG